MTSTMKAITSSDPISPEATMMTAGMPTSMPICIQLRKVDRGL